MMLTECLLSWYLISAVVGYCIGIFIATLIISLINSRLWINFWDNIYNRLSHTIDEYRNKRSYRKTIKELHTHPERETRDGVVYSVVLVDAKFEHLFTRVFSYWGDGLILVDREEYMKLKTSIYKQKQHLKHKT